MVHQALLALQGILHSARQMKLRSLLNGRFDGCDCWIEIVAGAGGDDSADWVTMLQRMVLVYQSFKSTAFRYAIFLLF